MAKFAFWVEAFGGLADVCIGFSWGRGGPENTAVYVATTFMGGIWAQMRTDHPVDIMGGFPGVKGKRIFLDIMGSSVYKAYVEVDFKIYEPGGAQPVFQIPTTSIQIFGLCTNGFSINTDIHRGGNVGNNSARIFLAGVMDLISPNDMPQRRQRSRDSSSDQFCGYSAGARLRAAMEMCP